VPVNTAGVLLILFGLGLLVLELKVPSFGVLGIGGTISLVIGSIMMTREVPGVRVGLGVILPAALALAAIFIALGRLGFKAQRLRPETGLEAMLGEVGRTRTPVTADTPGHVDIHGEIWRAISRVPVPPGAPVRVVEVNGLTLVVEPVDGAMAEGAHAWTA
jgi:membrane-bound serine protease (ClpP class)